jgi:CPA1 family monovalent cation:H+ antiporter
MTSIMGTLLFMLAVLAAAAVIAERLKTAPSIVLVVAGIGMALIPGLPRIQLAPEVVLLVILPPLIYSAGVSMSWREFRFNLRPITLLAFGCVVFTTCAVAIAAHYLLNFSWATGFVLGAIVAPPDVVAPLAIARRLALPRTAARGARGRRPGQRCDGLDPLSFRRRRSRHRYVLAAGSSGDFYAHCRRRDYLRYRGRLAQPRLRQWAHEPRVEITLSLMTPYLAFWVPEHLGGSGVLATVACGLYVSWNGPR